MSYTNGPEEITKGRSGANTGLWVALVVAVGVACFLGGYLLAVLAEQKTAQTRTNVVSLRDVDRFSSSETPTGSQRVKTWQSTGKTQPVSGQRTSPAVAREELVAGKPLPSLEFTAIDGRQVSVPDMKGKVVLVEFWATWCGPCVKEMPRMKAMYERWHDKGFEIVGISLDTDRQKLESYLAENGIVWPQYFDGKGWGAAPSRRFGIRGVPTGILIDREGNVVSSQLKGAELERTLTAMLSTDASEVAAAKAETARIEGIKTVTARGSRVEDEYGNWMEIVAVEPNPPAILKPGENLNVRIRYCLATDKPVQIFALPSKATSRRDRSSGSCRLYRVENSPATVDRYFNFPETASLSEICISMMDSESRRDMMTLFHECSAKWDGAGLMSYGTHDGNQQSEQANRLRQRAMSSSRLPPADVIAEGSRIEDKQGNWMEVIGAEPNWPATLELGQKLHVKVRYHLAADNPVQIWVRPEPPDGSYSHGSSIYSKADAESGVIDGWCLFKGPTQINQIMVTMYEYDSRRYMLDLYYPCSAEWKSPGGQTLQMPAEGISEK